MKKKFGEMHDRVQEERAKQQGFSQPAAEQKSTSKAPSGDYIDFEEVK